MHEIMKYMIIYYVYEYMFFFILYERKYLQII